MNTCCDTDKVAILGSDIPHPACVEAVWVFAASAISPEVIGWICIPLAYEDCQSLQSNMSGGRQIELGEKLTVTGVSTC